MLKMGVTEDPRGSLEKIRRTDLRKIIKASGIPVDLDLPAETLREVIRSNPAIMNNARVDDRTTPTDMSARVEITNPRKRHDCTGLNRIDLIRLCKENGIHASSRDTNAQLKAKLGG